MSIGRRWRNLVSVLPLMTDKHQLMAAPPASVRKRALIVVSASDVNCPSSRGDIADKIDPIVMECLERDFEILPILHPLSPTLARKTALGYRRSERVMALGLIRAVLRSWGTRSRRHADRNLAKLKESAWTDLLNEFGVDLVAGIGLGSSLLHAAACKSVPSIEFQHGCLGPKTVELCWPSNAVRGSHLPNLVLTWDAEYSRHLATRGMASVVTGPAYTFARVASPCGPPEPRSRVNALHKGASSSRRVLILTSWGAPGPFGLLDENILTLADALQERLGVFRPVFRLHPVVAASSRLRRAAERHLLVRYPECAIEDPRHKDLRESMVEAQVIMSSPTAAVFDAATVGKRVLISAGFAEGDMPAALTPYFEVLHPDPKQALDQALEGLQASEVAPYVPQAVSSDELRMMLASLAMTATLRSKS